MTKDYIAELSKVIEETSKTKLLKFMASYFNAFGIREMLDYFTAGSFSSETKDDQESARIIITRIKNIK